MSALHISVAAEEIARIGPLSITNALLTTFIVMIVLFAITLWYQMSRPVFVEMIIEGFYNFFEEVLGEKTKKLFPLLMTFFLFILVGNWLGIMPGVGPIGVEHYDHGEKVLVPLFRGPNADLSTTIALALISVSVTQVLSVNALGIGKYIKKFINFSNPINFFVGILELVSEFAKILSFSFRLFGNIFAGEVLLVVVTFLIPVLLPIPFYGLEIFVGFIQALVFTMLTMIFIAVATDKHAH